MRNPLIAAALWLIVAPAQAQTCEVWSRAENRCLQAASQQDASASPDRIAALEQDIARLRRENETLRATCVAPSFEAENRRIQQEQDKRLEDASWVVSNTTFGVTESNRVFVRYGWTTTVKNGTPRPQAIDLEVQFLDARGLVIDTAREYRQLIPAQGERTFRGSALISLPAGLNVASVVATALHK